MNERERIGKIIAAMREEKGLSPTELAEKAGITASNITRIENGKYNVGIDILAKISSAMDAEVTIIEK